MGKRVRVEDPRAHEQPGAPQPGSQVKIAVDLSRSKWVYGVRGQGAERLRLSTGGELKHLRALVRRYEGCRMHLAFEACGFGYEVAWWAQKEKITVTVIAPSRRERAPGLQVKTDRLDVGRMARQLEDGSLKGIYVPERTGHERRQGVRTSCAFVTSGFWPIVGAPRRSPAVAPSLSRPHRRRSIGATVPVHPTPPRHPHPLRLSAVPVRRWPPAPRRDPRPAARHPVMTDPRGS